MILRTTLSDLNRRASGKGGDPDRGTGVGHPFEGDLLAVRGESQAFGTCAWIHRRRCRQLKRPLPCAIAAAQPYLGRPLRSDTNTYSDRSVTIQVQSRYGSSPEEARRDPSTGTSIKSKFRVLRRVGDALSIG